MPVLFPLHYLPDTSYFTQLYGQETLWLEAHENYVKQSGRNRCYIQTANKVDRLSIPVLHNKGRKIPIREVEIDYVQKWQNRHWRAMQSAYAHAPFFEYYSDYFKELIYGEEKYLFDLNLKLLKNCLRLLGMKQEIRLSEQFGGSPDQELLRYRPVAVESVPYQQVFGEQFEPNLSIVDLLFCEGPNAGNILKKQSQQV